MHKNKLFMKNIHLLPTDKTSNLTIRCKTNELMYSYKAFGNMVCYDVIINKNQHLYITSDEFIEEDDFGLNISTKEIVKYNGIKGLNSYYKKIIMTTDEELIKDGVQAISEEFLQWFVKNPSCEEVKFYKDWFQVNQNNPVLKGSTALVESYKIIIPKEEPNPCKDILINDKATIDVPFHNKHIRFENLTSEQAGYLIQVSELYQLSGTRRSAVVPREPKQETNKTHYLDELPNTDKDVLLKMWDAAMPKQETQGYICPQTKIQCDDECCVSAEHCHIKASINILSEPKQETMTQTLEEDKLRQLFKSLSDCYADTGRFENDGSYYEGEVIQAMTEDIFIKIINEWQQERMYSEEEVKDMLFEALNKKQEQCCITNTKDSIVREVLKQYKKK
jgi:hypothetical protein